MVAKTASVNHLQEKATNKTRSCALPYDTHKRGKLRPERMDENDKQVVIHANRSHESCLAETSHTAIKVA